MVLEVSNPVRPERQLYEPHLSLPLPVSRLQEPRLHLEPTLGSHLQTLGPALWGIAPIRTQPTTYRAAPEGIVF